jgi:quinol monooxygenase YgiN
MIIQLVHHKVKDYKKWRPFYDEHAKARKEHGCSGTTLLRSTTDPNDLTVVLKWDTVEQAQSLFNAPEMKEIIEKSGVIGMPEAWFLEEVEKVPF